MAGKTVTLYIDDNSLRLMVTQGRRIKEWAESSLEPGLVENNVVFMEEEVAARIRQLFKAQKVKTKKIILGVSGLHCLTRPITLPQLPKEMLDEAVRREAQRTLPVPLEELYISWQVTPSSEGRTQVFMVAVPRKATDALLKTLDLAGLKPSFMDIKPLILAGIIKEPMALIVDIQATEFDIVVTVDGIPQPVRSISFPSKALPVEEKLIMVKDELNRTISFYNSGNPEKSIDSNIPIFASGELLNEPELRQDLSDEVGQPVLPLPLPLEFPEGFELSHYMPNICLTFRKLSSRRETGDAEITLNALPAVYQPPPISLTNIIAVPAAVMAAALIVFLVMFIQSTSSDIVSLSGRVDTTGRFLQQRQTQQQELAENIAGLESEISEVENSRDSFTAALSVLNEQTAGVNRDLEAAVNSLPISINLSSVGHITSILTVTGKSPGESQILAYIRELDGSGRFGDITIIDMTRTESGEIDFTLLGTIQMQSMGASSLEIALGSLPAKVSLTDVTTNEDTLTVNGTAPDGDRIFIYLRTLEASGKFGDVTISSMVRVNEGEMSFSLILRTGE
ncbi:PilN domain-containing protein [Chloroflexota bacterium]